MKTIILRSWKDEMILYQGAHESDVAAIEYLVESGFNFSEADLSGWNLSGANCDEAIFMDAKLCHTNLSNANLSEASFINCDFTGAILTNTCLAYSTLKYCIFHYSLFGATDIYQSSIVSCGFKGRHWTNLSFQHAKLIDQCFAKDDNDAQILFSLPPITIHGLKNDPISLFKNHILIDGSFSARADKIDALIHPVIIDMAQTNKTEKTSQYFY